MASLDSAGNLQRLKLERFHCACVGMYRSIPGTGTVLAELNCSTWNFHPVLLPAQDYGKTLKEAGFADVSAQDRTEQFTAILKEELDRFTKEKGNFLQVSM